MPRDDDAKRVRLLGLVVSTTTDLVRQLVQHAVQGTGGLYVGRHGAGGGQDARVGEEGGAALSTRPALPSLPPRQPAVRPLGFAQQIRLHVSRGQRAPNGDDDGAGQVGAAVAASGRAVDTNEVG